MARAEATLICTVLNEEKSVGRLFDSISKQTKLPMEIIIVDGGSKDRTIEELKKIQKKYKNLLNIKLVVQEGNRSVGRNEAIRNSNYPIILSVDSGNTLEKNWVKEIIKPFSQKNVDVVSGYYKGAGKTLFQKCLTPFVLVMRDKVDKNDFLPATRSMAFKKAIWKKVGKFNENLSHNEDYDFAKRLKSSGALIKFTQNAVANWYPRKNIKEAFIMFYRFALGDAESNNLRDKVLFIFLRYFVFLYLIFLACIYKSLVVSSIIVLGIVSYYLWAILKNSKYVKESGKIFVLPLLQVTSDIAVMSGTTVGLAKNIINLNYKKIIKNNKALIFIVSFFSLTVISSITWGIPNNNHPFLYHMDEWHQLQSVRSVFKYGSPNFIGAANGTMFHFFLTGIYLLPFIFFKVVNPFAIKSAIDSIDIQHTLFIILRFNTLIYSVLTLFTIYKISRNLRLNSNLSVILFAFTPVWIMLSNNFKYDIAFTFWLTFTIYSFLRYFKNPNTYNFIYASILSALSLSVKVTGAPLFPLIFAGYFLFTPDPTKNFKRLFLGVTSFLVTLILFGIPDIVFNGRNMNEYLNVNLNIIKTIGNTVSTGYSTFSFILFHHFPTIFGHALFFVFIVALAYFLKIILSNIWRNTNNSRFFIFLLLYLVIFILSFYPIIHLGVGANRALVILPVMVIIILVSISKFNEGLSKTKKGIFMFLFFFLLLFQFFETYAWVYLKHTPAPQEVSSSWILKNIEPGTKIGVENIPLYQKEPDIVLKEFYNKQYKTSLKLMYDYEVINAKTNKLPSVVIVTDLKLSEESENNTPKKDLINKLDKEKYKVVAQFSPSFEFYRLFGNTFNYVYSGLIAYPEDITIFKK